MFNAQYIIIVILLQLNHKIPPPDLGMSIAQSYIIPRALCNKFIGFCLEQGVDLAVVQLDASILRMDMIDRASQVADSTQWISPHPEGVAGVKIDSNDLADGITQPQQCFCVVNKLPGMLLNTELFDPVLTGIIDKFPPVRNCHILPLRT